MTVHERIRLFREGRGLTHQQFADAVGVSRGAVQQWEKEDGTAPNRKRQPVVAKFMEISVEELMASTAVATLTAPSPTITADGSASNHALAPVNQAQAATNNVASLDQGLDILLGHLAQVDASKRAALAGVMTALIHNPDDQSLRAALAALLTPSGFADQHRLAA